MKKGKFMFRYNPCQKSVPWLSEQGANSHLELLNFTPAFYINLPGVLE